jgi:membrane associated rhomboid family serine protease
MIPIRDNAPISSIPFITYLLIVVNAAVFIWMLALPENLLDNFILRFALIPSEIVSGINLYSLFTSMFLHGSIAHIIGNMLFLHIFGDNTEDRLGHINYLIFYLMSGLAGALLQILINPLSSIPNLGASGAIAGLLGCYLVLFPNHKVDILIPIGGLLRTTPIPSSMMLLYWIVFQLFAGFGSLGAEGGVAYFAHIGGFLFGILVGLFAKNKSSY